MTSNQLTLGKLREDIRHNRATEAYGYATLGESKRHNIQSEKIGYGNIGLGYSQLGEAKRHNIATESYQGQQALAYANKAATDAAYTELEITHYLDELKVKQDNAEAALRNAGSAEKQAEIQQQLTDIKADIAYWEKMQLGTKSFGNVAEGAKDIVGVVGDVAGLLS